MGIFSAGRNAFLEHQAEANVTSKCTFQGWFCFNKHLLGCISQLTCNVICPMFFSCKANVVHRYCFNLQRVRGQQLRAFFSMYSMRRSCSPSPCIYLLVYDSLAFLSCFLTLTSLTHLTLLFKLVYKSGGKFRF